MTASPTSLRRKFILATIVATSVLVALVGGLEVILRLADYGYSPHFARRAKTDDGQSIWRENRWCTAPFFSPALVRRPFAFRLPDKKAPGTYRIFVFGSSAAMGDPEPSFSVPRVLETLLRSAYPDLHFEVVNAAVTAINSHVVRGIAADCAELEPDLFIVYEGHNEVIGPFGPASVFAPFFSSPAVVRVAAWIKVTRTSQLVNAVARHLRSSNGVGAEWGGMQMFLKQQTPASDGRLDAVRTHFRANLLAVARSGRAAGASTLVCTVLTNQRDFAPFLSLHRAGLSTDELARWQKAFDDAEAAGRANNLTESTRLYRGALALDGEHAELNYRLGRLALQSGRDDEARTFLQRAVDLDALRFRTDSTLNDVVRSLSADSSAHVEVVDLAQHVAARSAHGVVGDDLLYEHVHLTLRGAYEVAQELLPRIAADLQRRGLVRNAVTPAVLPYSELRLRLGFTAHEQAMISLELLKRFRSPPFTAQSDHAARIAAWETRAQTATTLLARPDALPALRQIYQQALSLAPEDWILARNAGAMLVARGDSPDALPLLERARAIIDDDVDTWVALGLAHKSLNHSAEAAQAFQQARALEPRYPGIPTDPPAGVK